MNDSQTTAIELRHLAIGYAQNGSIATVATELSARFEAATLTCLLGNNGVGKSTLLRTIARLQTALSGEVMLVGNSGTVDVAGMSRQEVAQTIGVVLTDRPYAINLTAQELVAMGRTPHSNMWGSLKESDREAIRRAMELTGVDDFAQKPIRSLSDGMLQKAMIAKALAQQTPVILLDEPTAFLDFQSKVAMMRLLTSLAHREKETILMTTHDVQLALKLSDSIAVMSSGGIDVASPREMAAHPSLESLIDSAGAKLDAETMTIEF